jgi:hypothetical protein
MRGANPTDRPNRRTCDDLGMSEDPGHDSFEDRVRAIARDITRSVERFAEIDVDEIAETIGFDAARARELAESAGRWLAGRAESMGDERPFWEAMTGRPAAARPPAAETAPVADNARAPGPHPLDLPTGEQGLALSALDSGRWRVEPGSNVLIATGEGPAPGASLGLVGELRARDWIAADGRVTLVGHNALARWMDTANAVAGDSSEGAASPE